jgi:hypothetical protein
MGEVNEVEQLVQGQCLHGHANISDCAACVMVRFMVVSIRRALSGWLR